MVLLSTALTAIGNLPTTIKATVAVGTTAPTSPVTGTQWMDTGNSILKIWNGSGWVNSSVPAPTRIPTLFYFNGGALFSTGTSTARVNGTIYFNGTEVATSTAMAWPNLDSNGNQADSLNVAWSDHGADPLTCPIYLQDDQGAIASFVVMQSAGTEALPYFPLEYKFSPPGFNWAGPLIARF